MNPSLVELLAHLAGRVPDDLLESGRDQLARGDLAEVGRLVRFGQLAFGCTVPPDCYDAAKTIYEAAGLPEEDVAALVFPRVPVPPYEFGPGVLEDGLRDELDRAVVAVCRRLPGVRGVWRTWRTPVGGPVWPRSARMLVVEVTSDGDPQAVRKSLRDVGGSQVLVEVLPAGSRVPEYHRRARAASVLLWASRTCPAPVLAPALEMLSQTERLPDVVVRSRFRGFLESGIDLPGPQLWRTNGVWIWPAEYVRYLDDHGLAPHGPLFDHARSQDFEVGVVDSIAEHQARAMLFRCSHQGLYRSPVRYRP